MIELWIISLIILIIFFYVIIFVIFEKNRALISLIGALFVILIVFIWGTSIPPSMHIDFAEFIASNINIITLIIGLMLFIEIFLESGVFDYIALKMIKITKGSPTKLFLFFILFTYGMSTIIENVGAILIIMPLTITTCNIFIIAEQISTVCSGIILPISSIPNIIISNELNFTFLDFVFLSAPLSFIILSFIIIFIKKVYLDKEERLKNPPEKLRRYIEQFDASSVIKNKNFFKVSIIILFTFIICVVIFQEYAHIVVMICVVFLLIFSELEVETVLKKIDWNTIFYLIGLFIIINTMTVLGILDYIGGFILNLAGGNIVVAAFVTLWISGSTSGVVDNIPITLTLTSPLNNILSGASIMQKKFVTTSLVFGASLGGCFTPIGSPSGILTLQLAKEKGIKELNFKFYFKIGFIISLFNFIIASGYLLLLSFFLF
ncbi:MAG: SLC13 family permease [Promethearchaeota archaeon]